MKVSTLKERIRIMRRTLPLKRRAITHLRKAFDLGRYKDKSDLTALQKLIGSATLDSWIIETNIVELEEKFKNKTYENNRN